MTERWLDMRQTERETGRQIERQTDGRYRQTNIKEGETERHRERKRHREKETER